MKRTKLFLTGMAALALSLGLLFTGCGDGGSDDPPPPPQETSITYKSTGTVGSSPGVAHTFILEIAESTGPGASIRAYTPKATDTFTLYAGPTASFMQDKQTVEGTVGTPSENAGVTTLTLTPDTGTDITVKISSAGFDKIQGAIGSIDLSSSELTLTPATVEALTGVAVTFSGTEKSGSKLTAAIDSTTPAGAAGFIDSYQWLRDGDPIQDAEALEYTLTTSDEGATLKLRVTALGYTGYADSDATGTIEAGFKLAAATYTVVGAAAGVTDAAKVHYNTGTELLTYFTSGSSTTETLPADATLHKVLSGLSADDTFVVDAGGAISTVTFVTTAPDAAALTSVLDGVKAAGTVNLGANTTIDGDLTIPTGKTLDAKGVTVDIDHTGTDIVLTINGTLKSGTGSNIATLSGGVTITAGADEAALAASGAVKVDNTSNSIELAEDASIQLAGSATLVVGDGTEDVTFTLATITATADAAFAPDTTAGVVNIGGTSIALGNAGSIAATGAGVISAGDDTDNTALVLATITAPTGGDTITATAAGGITVPKSTIAFDAAGSGTAAIIGNGALVVGSSTLGVRLEKALYTNVASGNASFAVGSTGVITLSAANADTLALTTGGKIVVTGTGAKVDTGAAVFNAGTYTATGGIEITASATASTIEITAGAANDGLTIGDGGADHFVKLQDHGTSGAVFTLTASTGTVLAVSLGSGGITLPKGTSGVGAILGVPAAGRVELKGTSGITLGEGSGTVKAKVTFTNGAKIGTFTGTGYNGGSDIVTGGGGIEGCLATTSNGGTLIPTNGVGVVASGAVTLSGDDATEKTITAASTITTS